MPSDAAGRTNGTLGERAGGGPEGPEPAGVEPGARWAALALFALAAAAAGLAPLWVEGRLDLRAVREVAPLAAAIGGLLGWIVVTRWPRSAAGAAAIGALTAFVGVVFFCGAYLIADAVIEAARGGQAGGAIADASARLGARLPIAAPAAILAFMLAGLGLHAAGALGRRVSRARSRPRTPRRA